MNWKEYEKQAAKKLQEVFDREIVKIISMGKEDSTKPDIIISASNEVKDFYLEVKMPNSQSSQFVLEILNDKFIYGTKNRFKSNSFSNSIIDYMNKNFKTYNKVSQTGIEIPISEDLVNNWIISNLKNKEIEYIFSGTENQERIIPIDNFGDYFKATAYFRRKKSGSRNLAKNKIEDFKNSFEKKFNYIPEVESRGKKSYIKSNQTFTNDDLYIPSIENDGMNYYLSQKENNTFEIKILSSTNNPNVIFQIGIKENDAFGTYDLELFANLIMQQLNAE